MMSSLRPGTADYSHFDNISVSSSELEGTETQENEDTSSSNEDSEASCDAPVMVVLHAPQDHDALLACLNHHLVAVSLI